MFEGWLPRAALAATALGLCATPPPAVAQGFPSIEAVQVKSGIGVNGALYVAAGDHVTIRLTNWRVGVEHVAKVGKDDVDSLAAGAPDGHVDLILTNDPTGAVLHIRNGLGKPFYYHAKIVIVRNNQVMSGPATVCPVQPGMTNVEHWPQAIDAIRVDSFVETKADDSACR
jgi:hypothetical protein